MYLYKMWKFLQKLNIYNYCIAIYFVHIYFHDFGLGWQIREGLISRFCDVFVTINSHVLKLTFSRGLTREIRENKTSVKITTYTVHVINHKIVSQPIFWPNFVTCNTYTKREQASDLTFNLNILESLKGIG